MTLLRSIALATLVLAACGGSSKPSTMPAEPMPPTTEPAADEAATPVEPAAPAEPAMAPAAAAPAEEAAPAASPAPPPAARKTRAPVKKPAKTADPCDGGE